MSKEPVQKKKGFFGSLFGGNKGEKTSSPETKVEKESKEKETPEIIYINEILNVSIPNNCLVLHEEEPFFQIEDLIVHILSYLYTGRDDSLLLVQIGGVNKLWSKIAVQDKYWKSTLTIFQMNQESSEDVPTGVSFKEHFLKLKRKQLGIEEVKKKKPVVTKKIEPIDNPEEYYPGPIESYTYKEEPEENIVWGEENNQKVLKESTLDKLIEQLTSPSYFDTHFLHTFMLTFRSFTDREALFDKLIERFNIPPPSNLTKEEFGKWKVEQLDKIRLRVSSTIKYWIENFYHFDFDKDLKKKVNLAITMMNKIKGGKVYSQVIVRALNKAIDEEKGGVTTQTLTYPPIEKPKKSLFGGNKQKNKILTWPSIEIARQITLVDFDNFRKIEPKECLNLSWSKGHRETKAPGICAMIARFNIVSTWIGTVIVQTQDIKERVENVEKFIDIADHLWKLNNFNGVFAVCSGLALASVYRLKKTWAAISEESKNTFATLNKAISRDGNFAGIRTRIKNVKPPCIPYIGIYLTDLTFIEDGNPKYVNGKINFVKCKCFAGVIRDMQTYQNTKYLLEQAKELYDMLCTLTSYNDDEMFKASLVIEPKESKKKPEEVKK